MKKAYIAVGIKTLISSVVVMAVAFVFPSALGSTGTAGRVVTAPQPVSKTYMAATQADDMEKPANTESVSVPTPVPDKPPATTEVPNPTEPPEPTQKPQPDYEKKYDADKARLTAAWKAFAQASSPKMAGQLKNKYGAAMKNLQELSGKSKKVKKRLGAECGHMPRALGGSLESLYGTLEKHTTGTEAIQAHINGNVLTLNVYVNFKGSYNNKLGSETYTQLAKHGVRLWAGRYDGSRYDFKKNMFFTVTIRIHDIYDGKGAKKGQQYFDFYCLNKIGRSFVNYGVGYYDRMLLGTQEGVALSDYTNGTVVMHKGFGSKYTRNQYIKVSSHEFGHVLGLGDQYGRGLKHTSEVPNGTKYISGDMMGAHGYVTPNNIEMFLEAYRTNIYQAYVNKNPEKRSSVIKSY